MYITNTGINPTIIIPRTGYNLCIDSSGNHPSVAKIKKIRRKFKRTLRSRGLYYYPMFGVAQYSGHHFNCNLGINGNIVEMVRSLLEINRDIGYVVSGHFSYSHLDVIPYFHGMVFIAKDYTARIYEFDTSIILRDMTSLSGVTYRDTLISV